MRTYRRPLSRYSSIQNKVDIPLSKYLRCDIEARLENHLLATAKILLRWQYPIYVCRAGLFHSVYGTQFVTSRITTSITRKLLRCTIGRKAERLAHLFSAVNRSELFQSANTKFIVCKLWRNGNSIHLSPSTMHSLAAIEIANCYDHMQRIVPRPSALDEFQARIYLNMHVLPETALIELRSFFKSLPPSCFSKTSKLFQI